MAPRDRDRRHTRYLGCQKCLYTEKVVREGVDAAGIEAQINHVTDCGEIAARGVSSWPDGSRPENRSPAGWVSPELRSSSSTQPRRDRWDRRQRATWMRSPPLAAQAVMPPSRFSISV